jgi:hypothetical protein
VSEPISTLERQEWWLVRLGDELLWARLSVLMSGVADVLDSDGQNLRYDSEDSARAALMDADYRSLEGLDQADAAELGVGLDELVPPRGDSIESLRPQMILKLGGRA